MDWNLNTILILLAVLFAGYGIGLLEMHLRRQKKIKQLEAAVRSGQTESGQLPVAAPVAPPAEPGLLRLWIDGDQSLKLDLDGASLASPASATPEQRRRLITLLTGIRPWVEGGPVALASKRNVVPPLTLVDVPPVSDIPVLGNVIESPQPAPRSIVAQIDEVLQARLAGTPLAAKRIRLAETPGGGVLVFIGTARYESLDAIPDQEAVAAVRAAIAEWENRVK
jgi:hypothetical protein